MCIRDRGDKAKAEGISLFTYPTTGYFDAFFYALMYLSLIHILNTREGRFLPVVHCIKGSQGWGLYGSLSQYETGVRLSLIHLYISMTVIILRSCLCPHFFHQPPYGLSLRHHACSFLPAVPGNKKATIYPVSYTHLDVYKRQM